MIMKSLDYWITAYAASHQNHVNKMIHQVCVPVIFFTVVALLWKISFFLFFFIGAAAIGFYFLIGGKKVATVGGGMIGAALVLQLLLGFSFLSLLILFAAAWAGQFYGHKIEGQKPSFFDDLKFLLIGPLWVVYPALEKSGYFNEPTL